MKKFYKVGQATVKKEATLPSHKIYFQPHEAVLWIRRRQKDN